jgi:hypothetical protein
VESQPWHDPRRPEKQGQHRRQRPRPDTEEVPSMHDEANRSTTLVELAAIRSELTSR